MKKIKLKLDYKYAWAQLLKEICSFERNPESNYTLSQKTFLVTWPGSKINSIKGTKRNTFVQSFDEIQGAFYTNTERILKLAQFNTKNEMEE